LGQISFSYAVADNLQFFGKTALVTIDIVGASYQNPRNRFDVDDDDDVSPLDVLVVINALNLGGIRPPGPTDYRLSFINVDGNNSIDPIEVLQGEKQREVFQPRN